MTTENSRADALTVPMISRDAFYTIVRTALKWYRSDNPSRYLNDDQVDANDDEFVGKLADEHAKILAASPASQPAAAPIEETIRFCPECGRLGDIPAGFEACCPDWSQARVVPKRFAELCAETFKLCVNQPFPQSAPSPADERAAFDSWASGIRMDVSTSLEGHYMNAATAYAWAAWRARAASASETGADADHAQCCDTPSLCSSVRRCTAEDAAAPAIAATEAEIRKSMTSEQIQLERKLTCEAIDGAIAFGHQNTNPPPSADHWLAPYWHVGRKQAELESRSPAMAAEAVAYTHPDRLKRLADGKVQCETLWSKALVDDGDIPLYIGPQSAPSAEAVGEIVTFGRDLKEVSWRAGKMPEVGTKLYAAPQPPAQADAQDVPADDLVGFVYVLENPDRPHDPVTRFSRRPRGVKSFGAKIRSVTPVYSRPEQADARVGLTTKEDVELFAADLVKRGELVWAGFRQDADEKYTIPKLTPSVWTLIRALLDAHPGQPEPRASKCDGSGAVSVSVDDWSECPVCRGAGCQPEPHKWDEDGERCERCGDKDWMPDSACRGRKPEPRAEVTDDDASLWQYVSQHAVIVDGSTDGMVVLTIAKDADSGALELAARNAVELLAARTGASS